MNEQELWDYLTKNNPKWKTDGANLTSKGLRKLIATTHKEGVKSMSRDIPLDDYQHDKSTEFNHLFDTMFGGKK